MVPPLTILMSSQNGAMMGGEERIAKSVPRVLVYDLPNDSTPFVFTCNSLDGVTHNICVSSAY